MKRINKKLCSAVCALLVFSGNRGGALTKEILCNAGQWLACYAGYDEYFCIFNDKDEQGWVPDPDLTFGQKACGYAFGAITVLNAVDAAKRSYDIAHDIIKGSNSKSDTKKDSKNYWPILEAIFGISQFAYAFGHRPILDTDCEVVCLTMIANSIVGTIILADAYFRFRGSNQTNHSSNSEKNSNTRNADNIQAQKPKNEH